LRYVFSAKPLDFALYIESFVWKFFHLSALLGAKVFECGEVGLLIGHEMEGVAPFDAVLGLLLQKPLKLAGLQDLRPRRKRLRNIRGRRYHPADIC
jgi:hypothetical protein